MSRELLIILIAIVGAAMAGLVALWRLGAVARVRATLVELDGLTAEDDGERM